MKVPAQQSMAAPQREQRDRDKRAPEASSTRDQKLDEEAARKAAQAAAEAFAILYDCIERGEVNAFRNSCEGINVDMRNREVICLPVGCARKATLLCCAAAFGQVGIAQMLLNKGANPNLVDSRGRTAVHFACAQVGLDVLKLLVKAKADVNAVDWDGLTALHYCAMRGFVDGAKELLDAGAQIDVQTRLCQTPLVLAIESHNASSLAIVEFFIKSGSNIHVLGMHKESPLFHALDPDSVLALLEAGAKLDVRDEDGSTALHFAAKAGLLDVARLLLDKGADPNAYNNQKQTSLHFAAEKGLPDMCDLLLSRGADLQALDIARRSPEMLARRSENVEALAVLSKYREEGDDDEPLILFRPLSMMVQQSDKSNEFKLDLAAM